MDNNYISAQTAGTLDGLFRERVRLTPQLTAYKHFDRNQGKWCDTSWYEMGEMVSRWQAALKKEDLNEGDRVGLWLNNSREWVAFEQAALGLGLVVVPFYVDDRPDNIAYICNDSGAKVILMENEKQLKRLEPLLAQLEAVKRFVVLNSKNQQIETDDERVILSDDWLPERGDGLRERGGDPHQMATIVYTSGTTGRPKGVMLSHSNILFVAEAGINAVEVKGKHIFVSFLPISHMLERTGGYVLPMMMAATVAYARSIQQLANDIETIRPTALISVPRIYERIYERLNCQLKQKSFIARALFKLTTNIGWHRFEYQQNRKMWSPTLLLWPVLHQLVARKIHDKLGGRLQFAVTGGAALPTDVAKIFLGLGVNLLQGYGLTETSPVLAVNKPFKNNPKSVGPALKGIELKVGDNDELLARGPAIMLGYWNNHKATSEMIDNEGWLHTGDKACIEDDYVFITGRIKDIIVMSNGEKIPPVDMENAIALDPLFDQALIVGEGEAYLSALVVLNGEEWVTLAKQLELDAFDKQNLNNKNVHQFLLQRIKLCLKDFPGYAKIRRVTAILEPWTIENDLMTPTLKIKRAKVIEKYQDKINAMYSD
ncbi:MAG: long-chain fatty acid--CoA ligase [Gammaproteobacteria bacterium]